MDKFYPLITNLESSMPFYISGVGITENEREIFRPNTKDEYQILFTAQGRGVASLDSGLYKLESGSMLLHAPFDSVHYYAESEKWTTYWIVFSGTAVRDMLPYKSDVFSMNQAVCLKFFNEILTLSRGDKWLEKSTVILYEMLVWCKFSVFRKVKQHSIHERKERFKPVIDYMEKSYSKPLSSADMASLLEISQGQFCRLFRTTYHVRPMEYLNLLRIQKSKELLLKNRLTPIKEICRLVGFESPSYFCKLFIRYERVTPNEFRKSN